MCSGPPSSAHESAVHAVSGALSPGSDVLGWSALRTTGTTFVSIAGEAPTQVTTDGHDSYPRAVREVLGAQVEHRNNAYLHRRIEQDHRSIKQRYYPMLGFGAFPSAQRFCLTFEEVRPYFRPRRQQKQVVSLSRVRQQFVKKVRALAAMFLAA